VNEESQEGVKRQSLTRRLQARGDVGIYLPDGTMRSPDLDPLAKQRPADIPDWLLDPAQLTKLSEGSWFCRHVCEILSEDPLRNWFEVEFLDKSGNVVEDDVRARDIKQYHEELNAHDVFQTGLKHEADYGDGLVLAGIQGSGRSGSADPSQPVDETNVGEILYLVTKARDGQFRKIVLDDNIMNPTYATPIGFEIRKAVDTSVGGSQDDWVVAHASRAFHFQTRHRVSSPLGLPIHVPLWTVIQLIGNIEWSSGQIAYNMATRVLKSDEILGDIEQRNAFMRQIENEMNSLSFFAIGKEEDLRTASNNPGDLSWLINFAWDCAAAATRINKSRLLGTQAGALASADTDMKRYYEWIRSRQEMWLKPQLRRFVAMTLATDSLSTGQSATGKIVISFKRLLGKERKAKTGDSFRLVFNSPESQTSKEEANVKVREADALQRRAEAFKFLVEGLQTMADAGIADPKGLAKTLLGPDGAQSLMAQLFEEDV